MDCLFGGAIDSHVRQVESRDMEFINIVFLVSGLLIGFALGFVIAARIYYFSPYAKYLREIRERDEKRGALIEQELDNYFASNRREQHNN